MKDPVILPVSRVVIDRGTIRTVLLSKEVDPFNNVPYVGCFPPMARTDLDLKLEIRRVHPRSGVESEDRCLGSRGQDQAGGRRDGR